MTTNLVRTVFTFLTLAVLLASCSEYEEKQESRSLLTGAAQAMESNAKEAQRLLRPVRADLLNEADYAYFLLVQARVADVNGVNIAPLEKQVTQAIGYFTAKGAAPEAAFAYFMMGKVYAAQDNHTKELYCYQLADDWAGKANNQLPNFPYSSIPYNIASCLYADKHYKESLQYLEKALASIVIEKENFTNELYALELKGLNFKNLNKVDRALYCYDKALEIAIQHKDAASRSRILYNKYVLLGYSNDYNLTEERCKQLLPILTESKDSLHTGLVNLALARIYASNNRIDSAMVSIHKAEELLRNSESRMRIILYERLYLVEQQNGNAARANNYKRQHDEYKAQLESKRKAEEAELQALAVKSKEEGEWLSQRFLITTDCRYIRHEEAQRWWLIAGMALACAGCIYGLTLLRSVLRSYGTRPSLIPDFCRNELLAHARRRASLNALRRGADRICPSEDQVGRVAYMVDELVPPDDWSWRRLSPTASCSYAELVGILRRDFPQLNEKELEICALLYTQRLKTRQMADIVQVELPQFKEQRKSMRHKLREAGYNSRGIRNYVKRRIE